MDSHLPPPEPIIIDQSEISGLGPSGQADHNMGGTMDEPTNGAGNTYTNGQNRQHYVSQPADYPQQQNQAFSPSESDPGSRYNSPSMAFAQQQGGSRPGSGLSGQQGYDKQYQQENRQVQQQPPQNKNSVVIKVGMVGDAQIGKTSLMVKYVEGSWDEDYIQTLGMNPPKLIVGI